MLAGRDRDLDNVQALVERLSDGGYERSLIYSGLRGVGKTVLLMEFDVLASEAGWATTDVQEVGITGLFPDHSPALPHVVRDMSRSIGSADRVDRALRVSRRSASRTGRRVAELELEVEAARPASLDSGEPEQARPDESTGACCATCRSRRRRPTHSRAPSFRDR